MSAICATSFDADTPKTTSVFSRGENSRKVRVTASSAFGVWPTSIQRSGAEATFSSRPGQRVRPSLVDLFVALTRRPELDRTQF